MNDKRKGASISGAGVISGGTYDRVSISGAGKITGDIHTEELRISGAGKAKGKVEATKIVVSGSVSFADDVIADEIHVSGSAHVDGRITAKELKSSGSLKVAGDIASDYIKISGSLRAGADVETEIFRASGGFHIDGLLSADKIEIRIGGRCQAREIGGEQIDIRRGGWREKGIILDGLIKLFTGGGTPGLETTQIEGDEIYVEDTVADVVRGKRVEIGPGCRIKMVEYHESLKAHPDAKIDKQVKV